MSDTLCLAQNVFVFFLLPRLTNVIYFRSNKTANVLQTVIQTATEQSGTVQQVQTITQKTSSTSQTKLSISSINSLVFVESHYSMWQIRRPDQAVDLLLFQTMVEGGKKHQAVHTRYFL